MYIMKSKGPKHEPCGPTLNAAFAGGGSVKITELVQVLYCKLNGAALLPFVDILEVKDYISNTNVIRRCYIFISH